MSRLLLPRKIWTKFTCYSRVFYQPYVYFRSLSCRRITVQSYKWIPKIHVLNALLNLFKVNNRDIGTTTDMARASLMLTLNRFRKFPHFSCLTFHIETIHLICSANQMNGFYTKCNNGLKWVNPVFLFSILNKCLLVAG